MRIWNCLLEVHDPVFFASREAGRAYETAGYLHNLALTYALGLAVSPYRELLQVPRYRANLDGKPFYVSPASPVAVEFCFHTFKLGEEAYRAISSNEQKRALGILPRNAPGYGRAREITAGSTFRFFVLADQPVAIPRWIRLGKWMSKARVYAEEESEPRSGEGEYVSASALNPLDLEADPIVYDLICIPPVSLLDHARLRGPFWEFGPPGRRLRLPRGLRYFARQ
jgi:CRISPR-associated protein Csc1